MWSAVYQLSWPCKLPRADQRRPGALSPEYEIPRVISPAAEQVCSTGILAAPMPTLPARVCGLGCLGRPACRGSAARSRVGPADRRPSPGRGGVHVTRHSAGRRPRTSPRLVTRSAGRPRASASPGLPRAWWPFGGRTDRPHRPNKPQSGVFPLVGSCLMGNHCDIRFAALQRVTRKW